MSSFFLVGKGPDNDLILLSTTPVASRKDALAELSKLTSVPGFDHWDAEVFVLDLETGTPILLMRPEAAAEAPVAEVAEESEAEEALVVGEAEEAPVAEEDAEPQVADAALEAEAVEEPAEVTLEEESAPEESPAPEVEEPEEDEALAAVISDLAAESLEDAVVVEAPEPVVVEPADVQAASAKASEGETEQVDAAYAEAVVEAASDEPSTLKAALERTAAQMAASGITPPESVGPAAELAAADDEAVSEQGPAADAAWPWATSGEDDGPAFKIDALEEPGVDEGSLVRAAGDDDTMSYSRPVILGAYEEAPEESAVADVPAPEVEAVAPEETAPEPPMVEPQSDFILDLEQIEAAVEAEPAGYRAPDAPREMSCNDCVYVETCPNRDQRDPSTCGSFQWK